MNVSNKNISGSNYFLEKEKFLGKKNKKENKNKKDDSIGVECKDFDAKNKLENPLFKNFPKNDFVRDFKEMFTYFYYEFRRLFSSFLNKIV